MRTRFAILAFAVLPMTGIPANAIELLTSGDFETPGGVGDVPGWNLVEFATGSGTILDTAEITNRIGIDLVEQSQVIWLKPFVGGEEVGPDNLTNALISQTVAGAPGEMYTFSGHSYWEFNYSGGMFSGGTPIPLDGGPLDGQDTPTTDTFELAFLDAGGNLLSAPIAHHIIDDRQPTPNDDAWRQHTLMGTAPDNTASVRVTAAARDMVWNGAIDLGGSQSAFLDEFSLRAESAPGTELLVNPGFEEDPPDALDFWDLNENPASRDDILRTPIAGFSNHTPGGTRGVWLSAFFGEYEVLFEDVPVDGTMSQTVEAAPGGAYTFSGWTRFEQNYSGGVDTISLDGGTAANGPGDLAGQASPTRTEIVLEFLDSDGNVLSDETIDVKDERAAQCADGANDTACGPDGDGWLQHTLQAVAPEGTVSARLTGQMIAGVFNADPQQSAFFDDFSLDGPGPFVIGDMNGDGEINFGDLSPFALGLTNIPAYDAAFPDLVDTRVARGDVNQDAAFNFGDLSPFVTLLTGGAASGTAVPEPATALLWCGLAAVAMCCRADRRRA